MFPEGGRSRSGRVDAEATADGVGRLIKEVEGCRVLCVYLRGDAQRTWSNLPARGDTFTIATRLVEPRTDLRGLRASRDLATQVVRHLVEMERDYLEGRPPRERRERRRRSRRPGDAARRAAPPVGREGVRRRRARSARGEPVTAPPALGALGREGECLQGPEEARAGDGLLAEGVRGRALPPARDGGRAWPWGGSSTGATRSSWRSAWTARAFTRWRRARTRPAPGSCGRSRVPGAIPASPPADSPPPRSARPWASIRPTCGSSVGHRWRPFGIAGSRSACRCPTTAASSPSPARWPIGPGQTRLHEAGAGAGIRTQTVPGLSAAASASWATPARTVRLHERGLLLA